MFVLILSEPGKSERILYSGSFDECEKKKLEYSFTYHSSWLVVKDDKEKVKESKLDLLTVVLLIILTILSFCNNDE